MLLQFHRRLSPEQREAEGSGRVGGIVADGRLLVFDALLVPEAPPWAHWLDVHMLVLQDGKERSPDEFAALFSDAGFEMAKAVPIPAPVAIIEARPV